MGSRFVMIHGEVAREERHRHIRDESVDRLDGYLHELQ